MPASRVNKEWMSFEDPDEDRTWLIDTTFLSSSWECIFGNGCQGVLSGPAAELQQGCCSYGAHFSDAKDLRRVEKAARTLSAEQWQFRDIGRRQGIATKKGKATITRLVDGACVFLNRPGFPGGPGCALHRGAAEAGRSFVETKPDVCWQLPLRREDHREDSGHVVSIVTQWDRRHWGEAGEDFHWWCTEEKAAFGASTPLYQRLESELSELCGKKVYAQIRRYLDERAGVLLPHPVVRRAKPKVKSSRSDR